MKLFEFLQGPEGEWSMKRLFAALCFATAVVLAFVVKDVALVGAFLVPSLGVLVAGAATQS